MTKKVLLVAAAYPPDISSRSARMVGLAKGLYAMGWSVHVLTVNFPDRPPYSLPGSTEVIPKHIPLSRAWAGPMRYSFLWSAEGLARQASSSAAAPSLLYGAARSVMRRLRKIAEGLLIPDTFAEWIPFAICKGRRVLESFGPDLIFSSSNPASSHLVAAYLSREAHIPLVIEYGDPWNHLIERPRHGLRARIELWQERTVLQKASFVFMATHAARSLYVEKWSFLEHKIDVVENGYDPDDFSSGILPPSDEFRLTYAGVVHTGGRSVDAFIEALASMKVTGKLPPSLRINFWGEFSPVLITKLKQLGLDQVIRIGGWLNHNDFCRALLGSHGLLLFGNRHVQQVPGKLYHYLGAGRPVFLIDNSEEPARDHTHLLVSRQPHAIIVENSAEAISSALLRAYQKWSVLKAVDYVGIRDSASGETWTARARQLDHCFAQVVAR